MLSKYKKKKSLKLVKSVKLVKLVKSKKIVLRKQSKLQSNKKLSLKGGNLLDTLSKSIISIPKEKDYRVRYPGSGLISLLDPSTLEGSLSNTKQKLLTIIYNYRQPNQYDISEIDNSEILDNSIVSSKPYVIVNSMNKYLLVMYRQVIKKNMQYPKLLLYWLVGYVNRTSSTLFHYIQPDVKTGRTHSFVIKLYKFPVTDKTNTFIKINNINKQKAYIEFQDYIKSQNLISVTTLQFKVRNTGQNGFDIFSLFNKKKSKDAADQYIQLKYREKLMKHY